MLSWFENLVDPYPVKPPKAPPKGFAAFLWDGIYIGATASAQMRNAMIFSSILFFACFFLISPHWGNNGLWLSFILYLLGRGVIQTIWSKKALKV